MLELIIISLIVCPIVILLGLFLTREYQRNHGVPPGPYGLPWIGYAMKLKGRRSKLFAKLCEKYKSDVVSVTVFGNLFVTLNTIELVKEIFQKRSEAAEIPDELNFYKHIHPGHSGILNTSGDQWKEVRRFSISTICDFCSRRAGAEEKIQNESNILCELIKKTNGQPFDPETSINVAASNIICGLVFGQRYRYDDDEEFRIALSGMNEMTERVANPKTFFLLQHKFARDHIINKTFQLISDGFNKFRNFVEARVNEHKANYTGQTTDLIYSFLKEMEDGRNPEVFDNGMLTSLIIDFFSAGIKTTYSTLRWALLAMAAHPDIQKKVQQELDTVIGNRQPSILDKKDTPYCEAVLSEVQRHFTLIPLGVVHSSSEEFYINEYRIPKGSIVAVNIDSIHHDRSFWKNPEEFDPENFLKDGKVSNLERLIPFSFGRRSCAGEALARMELYLFFATLVKNFAIKLEADDTVPNFNGVISLGYTPPPFKVRMEARY